MSIDHSIFSNSIADKVVQLSEYIKFEKMIEKGGNGYVLVGRNSVLNRDVVVKFYYWGNGDHAEPALLAQLESDYILKVYHAEHIDEQDAFFMTPYCANGDLDDTMSRMNINVLGAVDIILQVASGVSYLHGQRFLHRDLKPSNVFCLSDGKFVIGDFGSVVRQNEYGYSQTLTRHSLLYRPPEELVERCSYEQGDIYQLGLMLFQLLGGALPYNEAAWLNDREQKQYNALTGFEQQDFARGIIEKKISLGKIVDFDTLPCWVPAKLTAIIRKCCKIKKERRFETVAALIGKINNIRGVLPDWRIGSELVLCTDRANFRIVEVGDGFKIEKKVRGASAWRTERSFRPSSLPEAVKIAEGL